MSRKRLSIAFFTAFFILFLSGCAKKKKPIPIEQSGTKTKIYHATGFSVESNANFTVIEVTSPWPGTETTFKYALVPKEKIATITLSRDEYDAIVATPVKSMVVTSTTHIPSLEALGELKTIKGFPNTNLISSSATRELIDSGQIMELGTNENINTEVVLELNPGVVVGFGINDTNKAYETLKRSGVPVVYNGEWIEETPLGKSEWIKFFAPFFQKEKIADSIFKNIEESYNNAKLLALRATQKPTVLTGGLYKDVWYISGGKSWMAKFLEDANSNYIWSDTEEQGSIGMSLEAVLEKGQQAEFWLNPSLHTTYDALEKANSHYKRFKAFSNKKIYSNAVNKGATGGLLFYELAPQRPDLVLKDLISILHPELLQEHEPNFYLPLQ
ncbi:putative lipoprotein [Flagellimonas maritima]|uniref:Putative lipoprotein n=1 Tax=Flagellimonas maritima TaxID=1383885 RepID=A0A2Z4LP79_9FLAO|nr:ABC transporter substrate-binding protein [Allomuricauda aurantiaca]AWX43077.1 putative lipoprotein [Allomuricauda aurantiaca]